MDFRVGDPVVHWTYGLGQIVGLEERALTSQKMLYYLVQIQGLTVCVPADDKAVTRLRFPTPERDFKKLFVILSGPGESLSEDRLQRKAQLRKKLDDGNAEAICEVIRDLSSYEQKKSLNEEDKHILKQAWNSLLGEWGFSMSVSLGQAEIELRRLLKHPSENVAGLPEILPA
jgi:RNA polymerase-interacting CarD/CdnL/TRCF family regulator